MSTKQFLDLSGLTRYNELLIDYINQNTGMVFCNTTAYWNAQTSTPSVAGAIYIYSDHDKDDDDNDIPGIKVGTGNAYVPDLPFIDYKYDQHLLDTVKHITAAERTAWNNKVRCYMDTTDTENLIFTTN
jgi:hypothetical protein